MLPLLTLKYHMMVRWLIGTKFQKKTLVFGLWALVQCYTLPSFSSAKFYATDLQADSKYFAKPIEETIREDYETIIDESFELSPGSLPAARTQDGANTCRDHCNTGLIQYRLCQESGKTEDCSSLNDNGNGLISTVFVRMLGSKDPITGDASAKFYHPIPLSSGSPENYDDFKNFNLRNPKAFYSESCFPFDQFVKNKNIGSNSAALLQFYDELHLKYQKAKEELKTLGREATEADFLGSCKKCDEVREQLAKNFPKILDLATIANALNLESYEEFLGEVKLGRTLRKSAFRKTDPNCKYIQFKRELSLGRYPGDFEKISTNQIMDRAKEELKKRKAPIRVSGICIARNVETKECGNHCMLMTGFKKVRNKNSPYDEKTFIRFLNSWGDGWQKKHNGGWVDQDKLEKHLTLSTKEGFTTDKMTTAPADSKAETSKSAEVKPEKIQGGNPDVLTWLE